MAHHSRPKTYYYAKSMTKPSHCPRRVGRRLGWILATAPPLILLACNGSTDKPGAPSTSATGSVAITPTPTPSATATSTGETKGGPPDVTGAPAPITWPALPASAAAVRGALPKAAQERIRESRVPALVPEDTALLHAGVIVVSPSFYAFSATAGGVSVAIHGTNVVHDYPHLTPAATGGTPLRGTKGLVTLAEGIRHATWIENGVAYAVDVECDKAGDERCTKDTYVVGLVEKLVYVGGAHAGGRDRDAGTRDEDRPPRDERPQPGPGGP
jgi:hypothetical protein